MIMKSNLGKMLGRMAPRGNMPQGGLSMAAPRTGYRMPQNPMMASPGGGGGFDERTGTYTRPANPIFNALRNVNIPMAGGTPNTASGMFGGMQPPEREVIGYMTPPPGVRSGDTRIFADQPVPQPVTRQPFDPNAALQAFNKRAAELNASGKGLFASGMVPDEFRMYQGILRNLQLNPNSTPEQHADILNKSMAFLNQYSGATPQLMVDPNVPYRPTGPDVFNPDGTPAVMKPKGIGGTLGATRMTPPDMAVGPVMPMPYNPVNTTRQEDLRGRPGSGMGIGAFLGSPGEAIQAGGMLPRLAEMFNPKPRQPTGVDNATFIAGDPNFRFGETPQVKAPNAQAMAMGGLLRKYYGGGMC